MTAPLPEQEPRPAHRVVTTKVFVRGLHLDAEVGVYPHERGRLQPLVVDVELDIAAAARELAASGHIELVEVFAERLAERCFADPRVTRAKVRVEKPQALAPEAAGAGVEITAVRG